MYPGRYAASTPEKPALIMAGSGEQVSYRELDERSNRLARLWWNAGLRPDDHVAIFMENHPRYYDVAWAALRSGLHLTPVNRFLTAEEAAYIVNDCGARALVGSSFLGEVAEPLAELVPGCSLRLMVDGLVPGWESYEEAVADQSSEPLEEEPRGAFMFYSSGTTGQPKGILRELTGEPVGEESPEAMAVWAAFGMSSESVYLSPAPLYHSAPLAFSTSVQSLGGTVIVMEKFDGAVALQAIERHRVTISQWVPTMFGRMLKLPEEERSRWDLSSHRVAIHAAAPCPVEVKRKMIEWWGPILLEYYAGSESNGLCFITSPEWLERPGSVGRCIQGSVHICDDAGEELPPGEPGIIYFEQEEMPFEYHNDPDKTRDSQHPEHPNWSTLYDVGYVDNEGYVYLTDRKAFMIISGGVNIYPQEIEDALVVHPQVADAAVIGVPNQDMGEEVKAVVQLMEGVEPGPEMETELIAWARERIAHYKVPRSVDFTAELPRLPTGKLYKRVLREQYWGSRDSRIV